MTTKISNVTYDQIPHIVINHPDTNPEHKWSIIQQLRQYGGKKFEQLRQICNHNRQK
jgi:hypothetical protein